MQEYINRLLQCGWRIDNAYVLVDDFISEYEWDELEEFVQSEERAFLERSIDVHKPIS